MKIDPTENWKYQVYMAEVILRDLANNPRANIVQEAERLAMLVLELRDWIARGGVLPDYEVDP